MDTAKMSKQQTQGSTNTKSSEKQQAEDTAWEVLRQEWILMPPLPDEEEMEPSQDTLYMMWEEKQEKQRRLSETID